MTSTPLENIQEWLGTGELWERQFCDLILAEEDEGGGREAHKGEFCHTDVSHAKLCHLPSRLEMVTNTSYLLYPLGTGQSSRDIDCFCADNPDLQKVKQLFSTFT